MSNSAALILALISSALLLSSSNAHPFEIDSGRGDNSTSLLAPEGGWTLEKLANLLPALQNLEGMMNSTDSKLPWSLEELDNLRQAIANLLEYEGFGNMTDAAVERVRRSTGGNNKHWCCVVNPPPQTATRNIVRSRVMEKKLPKYEEYRCGWFKTCRRTTYVTTLVIEYYMETDIYEVPAEGFEGGCPDAKIECCEGYLRLPPQITNCLTADQMNQFLPVLAAFIQLGLPLPMGGLSGR